MTRENLQFSSKDVGLRDDVRVLGALVGQMLREQGGEALFDAVERARLAAIRRREVDGDDGSALYELVKSLPSSLWRDFIRGFSTWFQVVNIAEQVHRIRRRRDYLRDTRTHQPGGLEDTFVSLASQGVDFDQLRDLIARLSFEPVFTAHPTEPTRRTILRKYQRIARQLVDRLDPSLTPTEERAAMGTIRAEVTSAWQTEEHPGERMTVADELEHIVFFMTEVIYRIVPVFYEMLEDALRDAYGDEAATLEIPTIIRLGSWVGGDMDGNPNVSAKTIKETLTRHRALILSRYHAECLELAERLSQNASRVSVSAELDERIDFYGQRFAGALSAIHTRHRNMPYRVFMRLIAERLQATYDDADARYQSPDEFLADIDLVASSLKDNKGSNAGLFAIERLRRRARTFGFHLATLDVRQDALVHRQVVGTALGEAEWLSQSPEQRIARLRQALDTNEYPRANVPVKARKTLAVFDAIGFCRRRYGEHAIGHYIVSMSRDIDDVLSVLLLARWSGLGDRQGQVPLDVVPLFETVSDLERGPHVLQSLLENPHYRAHLAARGDRQTVMVGYSDSNKDGGLASARWALQQAQASLFEVVNKHPPVDLVIFHGRGGTISRGGGKTHTAVLGAPPGTVRGRLRATEQGEMINAKYGLRGIALRNLEQAVSSVALATALPPQYVAEQEGWHAAMQTIAQVSRQRYRELVLGDDEFVEYFRQATPIDVIERMQIGSRPATRRSGSSFEHLRAIPWVFAWTQNRCILPGWFGCGTGLAAAVDKHGERLLRDMFARWHFLRGFIEDLEMVLAKCDMDIAAHYERLVVPPLQHYFTLIHTEFDLTVQMVLRLKGIEGLLQEDPTLQRAIRLRNPYVDPMSLLQVELLARWRADGRHEDETFQALLASINGIAHGLQNTG